MPTFVFNGTEIEFDKDGYLVDPMQWSRELAVKIAKTAGFQKLGEDRKQWVVLEFLRDMYLKNMLPNRDGEIIYIITKGTGLSLSKLHRLFEGLSIPNLLKWAGLPQISCPAGV